MAKKLGVLANWTIPVVIGAILGVLGNIWVTQFQNRVRYLDYAVSKQNVIEQPKKGIKSNQLKIIFENDYKNPIQIISQVTFRLYNVSDQDYANVDSYIEIIPRASGGKIVKIIPSEPIAGLPENVEKQPKVSSASDFRGQRYGYKIKTLNRTENIDLPAFEEIYTILGAEADKVEVKPNLVLKGVELRKFSSENFYASKNWLNYFVYKQTWIIFVIPAISYFAILWVVGKFMQKRRQEKCILSVKTKFSQPGEMERLKQLASASEIAEYIVKTNQELRPQKIDLKALQFIADKLSQPGEIDQLKQQSNPLVVAEYFVKTYWGVLKQHS